MTAGDEIEIREGATLSLAIGQTVDVKVPIR
jgi:hypothetical protein